MNITLTELKIKFKTFSALSTTELYEILRARSQIFMLEQKIICQDMDRIDYDSLHCFIEHNGSVIAYLRAFLTQDKTVQIGRVLTTTHGIGLGKKLISEAIPIIAEHFCCNTLELHAQSYAKGFYEKLGFEVISKEFMEEGVPHVTMTRTL